MVTISADLREKIERRSRRAWRRRREGDTKRKFHRISSIDEKEILYRVPYTPDYYGQETVRVVLQDDGTVVVDPPTTGLIELKTRGDLERIKKHAGEIKGYVLVTDRAIPLVVGKKSSTPCPDMMSREQCVEQVKRGNKIFVVEAHADDVDRVESAHISMKTFDVVEELDPIKDLGFTTGLFDLRTKADVESLRKKKHLGRVRAYKYTTKDAESPVQYPKIKYEPGKDYEIKDADTDPASHCHKGINVANFDWAKGYTGGEQRIFAFEFEMEDIAAIPTNTDGKFRVHRCTCIEEIDTKTLKPIPVGPKPSSTIKIDVLSEEDEMEQIENELLEDIRKAEAEADDALLDDPDVDDLKKEIDQGSSFAKKMFSLFRRKPKEE